MNNDGTSSYYTTTGTWGNSPVQPWNPPTTVGSASTWVDDIKLECVFCGEKQAKTVCSVCKDIWAEFRELFMKRRMEELVNLLND